MEYNKFAKRREPYWKAPAEIMKMGFTVDDYIHRNPAFAGHMNLSRFLALYEKLQVDTWPSWTHSRSGCLESIESAIFCETHPNIQAGIS